MATRKITRKVITPVKPVERKKPVEVEQPEEVVVAEEQERGNRGVKAKKGCLFCQSKQEPSYADLATLKRFMTDRAKIVSKERSGACSRHQRAISKNIKWARHLALLPFVPKV